MRIGPSLSPEDLHEKSGLRHQDGRVYHGDLPSVLTDAEAASKANPNDPNSPYFGSKYFDPHGYAANRELAKRIDEAFKALKVTDKDGPHFVLAWRMYPNANHPRWKRLEPHACGCGCG
jgi:hypothetical protein